MRSRTPNEALARLVAASAPYVEEAEERETKNAPMSDRESGLFAAHFVATVTLRQEGFRFCRMCGCSEQDACAGGCHWVAQDLCSACAATEEAVA